MAYLELDTPDGSRRVTLERDRVSIGRLSYNDVVLAFPQISRQHAELRRINGQWWITDLHSTNGLLLDMQRIQEHALRDGDHILLAPGIRIHFVDAIAPSADTIQPASDLSYAAPHWELPPTNSAPPLSMLPDFMPSISQRPSPPSGAHSMPPAFPDRASAHDATPFAAWSAARTAGPAPASAAFGGDRATGYPAPRGPFQSGADGGDLYRRDVPAGEGARATAGPAGALLHVCQTCGQLTAANAVYCQHCHNSIAAECPNCRLSLLPVQDRCPRCHTPNMHSVRRAHVHHTSF
ncbi:MAG: FHA domain-containing protein [Ktedonobacterales bacterium]